MRLFAKDKDGGKESTVWGYWLIEAKRLLSVAILCFEPGSRDAYHSHAFNSISWVIRGRLEERNLHGPTKVYTPRLLPYVTRRSTFHKVVSTGRSWVFTLRGPWVDHWQEWRPAEGRYVTLTHGRHEVGTDLAA